MGLVQDVPELVELAKESTPYLEHNRQLFDIYEGNLKPYIEKDLRDDFSPESFKQVMTRIAPINLLTRVVDKLAKIYSQAPARAFMKQNQTDDDLLRWYEKSMKLNRVMNQGNEFFNLFKSCLLQPYVVKGKPKLRAIPSDRFIVRSTDPTDPTRATCVVLYAGCKVDTTTGEKVAIYNAYTDEEIIIFNGKGEIEHKMMAELGNPEGINVFERIPFAYVNRSLNRLMPTQDTDMMAMVKLFPILLSDLGYAIKFQAFSVIYGIDLDDESMKMAPNAFWRFKSDPKNERQPQLDVIKPQVDITEVQGFIQFLLGMWLQSKNIRPGAIGDASPENFASGISKMVDEMDTSEDRAKQVEFFKPAEEEDLWPLIMHHMHPFWAKNGLVENVGMFSAEAEIEVNFAEQLPLVRRGALVKDLDTEVKAGFCTRVDAIMRLNPQWTEEQAKAKAAEVEAEHKARGVDANGNPQDAEEDEEGNPEDAKKEDEDAA